MIVKQFLYTLEAKFISLAMVIVLVSSMVIIYYVYNTEKRNHFTEAERQARLLSESTAISFINTLLYEEIGLVEEGGLLENQISDLMNNKDTELIEMVVLNPRGHPIAASEYSWYDTPSKNPVVHNLILTKEIQIEHETRNNLRVIQVVTPLRIYGKRFGTLVAYFSIEKEYKLLAAWRNKLLLFAVLGLFGALGMAYIVARILATPIKRLSREMVKVSDPYYRSKLVSTRHDEIGLLEEGFLSMMDRLQQAAIEEEKSQKALIQTEKMAALGTLAAGLAHEINNPLGGATNCLRRIESQPEDISQTKKYILLMKNALSRIENLVGGLLQLSRGKDTILQQVDVNSVITQAVEFLEYKLRKKNILFNQKLSPALPLIFGDKEHLDQVFINLILNAVDALPEGGELSILTSFSNQVVTATIKDNGIGIPQSELHKIFDPFYTTKDVGQGTGLGLTVCKNIIESHDGTIEVESEVGKGTEITLNFPAMKESSERQTKVSCAILAGGKSSRMGTNKALVKLNKQTLIERVVEKVDDSVTKPIIITNTPEDFTFMKLPSFPDVIKNIGPLGGIYTALKHCNTTHCLIIACDLPFLTTELFRLLFDQGLTYDVLAIDAGNGVEPLCAVYSMNCLPKIKKQLDRGNFRVTDFFSSVKTTIINLNREKQIYHPNMFFNINTPEDLKEAEEMNDEKRIRR